MKFLETVKSKRGETSETVIITVAVVFTLIAVIVGYPLYNVWTSGLAGKAQLEQAEYNRQISVREAEAKRQSSSLLAEAEIERAKGVAEANRIIGQSLNGNESYLRYLWIQNLESGQNQVIYVPTEAGLPILEAGNRK